MSVFCPTCSNMLLIGTDNSGSYKWACNTCPFDFPIKNQLTTRTPLPRKQVDDIMGGDEAWKNVDSTDATCPKCNNERAFFMQLQIRSADEPSTTFFRCTNAKCAHQWREG